MAAVLLARAGVLRRRVPRGAVGAVLGLCLLTVLSNAVTPSAERAPWLPGTLARLAAALLVSKA